MSSTLTLVSPANRHSDDPYPQTAESIAAAKLACLRERARVTELTGVTFTEEGRMRLPHLDLGLVIGNAIAAAVYGVRGEHR